MADEMVGQQSPEGNNLSTPSSPTVPLFEADRVGQMLVGQMLVVQPD